MSVRQPTWFQCAVAGTIIALVALAHGGAVNGGFHYDDFHAIVENPAVRTWSPAAYFLSSGEGGSYRPVTVASFALNDLATGMKPAGFLVVNLILHVANAWLVYLIGRRLLRDDRWAAVAAVGYAIHPVNAEAVNYVVARSSLLSSFGALAACWALLRRDEGGRGWLAVSVAAFGVALLSKEAALALVPPILAWGWLPERDHVAAGKPVRWIPDARVALIFVGVSVLFLVLWKSMTAGRLSATPEGAAVYPVWTFIEIVVRSLLLWIWPWPLGLDHPLAFVHRFDPVFAAVCVSVIVLLGVLAAWSLRRDPFVAWCVIWILAGFAPLLPIPWLTTRSLFQEHRLSFSAAGLAWLTAWVVRRLLRAFARRLGRPGLVRAIGFGAAGLVVLGAVLVDRSRSWVWNDDLRLWEEAVSRRPDDPLAYANVGIAYYSRGALEQAERAFQRAAVIEPNYLLASFGLGQIYGQRGRWEDAEAVFKNALNRWDRIRSDVVSVGGSQKPDRARWADPQDAQKIRFALAYIYLNRNDLQRAQALYEEATRADAADFRAWSNLGVVAERRGLTETARDAYRRALALSPDDPQMAVAVRRLEAGS